MKHWLTAMFLALGLAAHGPLLQAAEATQPSLKISYAIDGDALPGNSMSGNETDLWQRIRAGFRLPVSSPELTQAHERWFRDRTGNLERVIERSRPYLYHIVDEVARRDMPMEIALLPIIESAFNPMALSPRQASGIWQFIPSTGKVFGLDQNGWYDGRRDVVQATKAALDYLQKLHGMFGDWELALAAYNCGEGCVARALTRHGGKDYAALNLPAETRNYVPKLVAVRNIIQDPAAYGVQLAAIPNEPYFMPIRLKRPIEARTAARLAEMSLEDFTALNPGFQRRVIHTDTRDVLLLPADRVETFQFNLHRQGLDKGTLETYAAKKGESLSRIADRFNISVAWLKEHNPLNLWRGKLTRTQELVVPKAVAAKPAAKVKVSMDSARPRAVTRKHTVRKGETLMQLARHYNVKVLDIQRLNDITDKIKPGMELDIPAAG
ncbi:MAG: transglycosylase SLT domain-containing protein [Pseudomonadota bacterium]